MNNSKPFIVMALSVLLWSFYPPLVNSLTNNYGSFFLALTIHSFATFVIIAILFFPLKNKIIHVFKEADKEDLISIFKPNILSGLLIALTHVLFFYALSLSTNLDITAVLVFEAWPLIFLYLDTVFRRKDKSRLTQDVLFSLISFIGFIILTLSHVDLKNFEFENNLLSIILFSGLGGITMATNCYFRALSVTKWNLLSEKKALKLKPFKITLFTEIGVRIFAIPFFLILFLFSNDSYVIPSMDDLYIIFFIGFFILALGSIFYDFAIYSSKTSAIGALWYFMPIGSIFIMSFDTEVNLGIAEYFALFLLTSSNLLISKKNPISVKNAKLISLLYLILSLAVSYFVFL